MELMLVLGTGCLCILSFVIGAKVGQTVTKGKDIELPKVNLMEMHREREAKREAQREQDRIDTIMRNIESYDGTGNGQKEVR